MEQEAEVQTFAEQLVGVWEALQGQAANMLLPSRLMQIGVLLGCFGAAWLLSHWLSPRLRDWLRTRDGWPKWRLRAGVMVQRRLQLVFFALLCWGAVGVVSTVSIFPSRRFILVLVATIATAWLAVSLAARLVRNPFLRQVVTWGL